MSHCNQLLAKYPPVILEMTEAKLVLKGYEVLNVTADFLVVPVSVVVIVPTAYPIFYHNARVIAAY
jgi:hypothetical protein